MVRPDGVIRTSVSKRRATWRNTLATWCGIRVSPRISSRAIFSVMSSCQGRADSPTRPVRTAVRLHPYSEGNMLLLSRDITAVEQAEAMRRDFVANVSHEIRTPLTVLAGFIETLQSLPL